MAFKPVHRRAGFQQAVCQIIVLRQPLVPLGEDRFAWLDDPSWVLSFEMSDGEAVALRLGTVVEPVRSRFEREQAR